MLGPIFVVLYAHFISEIVSYHSLSHHCFSYDNQLYKSGNASELPEIIHSTQFWISDVKSLDNFFFLSTAVKQGSSGNDSDCFKDDSQL